MLVNMIKLKCKSNQNLAYQKFLSHQQDVIHIL
jgi:hypothetical protein